MANFGAGPEVERLCPMRAQPTEMVFGLFWREASVGVGPSHQRKCKNRMLCGKGLHEPIDRTMTGDPKSGCFGGRHRCCTASSGRQGWGLDAGGQWQCCRCGHCCGFGSGCGRTWDVQSWRQPSASLPMTEAWAEPPSPRVPSSAARAPCRPNRGRRELRCRKGRSRFEDRAVSPLRSPDCRLS